MANLDPIGHALDHWPPNIDANDPKSLGARLRRAALLGLPASEADRTMLELEKKRLQAIEASLREVEQ